jgi:hypothetical protein
MPFFVEITDADSSIAMSVIQWQKGDGFDAEKRQTGRFP